MVSILNSSLYSYPLPWKLFFSHCRLADCHSPWIWKQGLEMGFEQELVALPLLRDYDQISLLEEPRTNLSHPSCSSWGHSRPGEDFKYLPSSEAVQPRLLSQTVSNPFLVLPFISYVSLSKLLNFSHQRMIGTVATSQSYYGIKWLLWVKHI